MCVRVLLVRLLCIHVSLYKSVKYMCTHVGLNVRACQQCVQYVCSCQCVYTHRGGLMYFCPISEWPNSLWLCQSHSVVVMDSLYHYIQSPFSALQWNTTQFNSHMTLLLPRTVQSICVDSTSLHLLPQRTVCKPHFVRSYKFELFHTFTVPYAGLHITGCQAFSLTYLFFAFNYISLNHIK